MNTGKFRLLRCALMALLLIVCAVELCPAQTLLCADQTESSSAIHKASSQLALNPDVKFIYRAINLPKVAIEVRLGGEGKPACYNPLSGWSIYWDAATKAVKGEISKEQLQAGSSQIFVFDDPGHGVVQGALHSARRAKSCFPSDPLEAALTKGLAFFTTKRIQDAEKCYDLAVHLAPNSVAANYGVARTTGAQNRQKERITAYEKTVQLAPWFYEVKIELAYAYTNAAVNRLDDAEAILRQMTQNVPLPVAERSYEALTTLLDKRHRRKDAAQAKKSYVEAESRLRSLYPPLVGEAVITFDTKDLAMREEEVGDFQEALDDFTKAVRLANVGSVSEAVRFQADLGRLRNARRLGNVKEAGSGCEEWQKRLNKLGRELDDAHWEGKAVAKAQWEASCGDFNKAFTMLYTEVKRVPDSDIPYRAIADLYRSVGKSELANRVNTLAERVRTEHDKAVLKGILAEAEHLVKDGNVVVIEK